MAARPCSSPVPAATVSPAPRLACSSLQRGWRARVAVQASRQHGLAQIAQPRASSSPRSPQPASSAAALALLAAASLAQPEAAGALAVHAEPANALSLPTWAIHVSSVTEWVVAMGLMWRYADVSGNPAWRAMTWGMLPSLGSAMAACTWHFFYNAPELDWLVALQALLTVVGNCTLAAGALRVYQSAQPQGPAP